MVDNVRRFDRICYERLSSAFRLKVVVRKYSWPESLTGVGKMFEDQYNNEMEAEVRRLEAKQRAVAAGHPDWLNACAGCGCKLLSADEARCPLCGGSNKK